MTMLIVRLGLSLLAVAGVGWLVLRLAYGPTVRRERVLSLLARQQLTRGSAVAIVQVADRALVLGVTEHGVSLLTETDLEPLSERLAPTPPDNQVPTQLRHALRVLRDRAAGRS